MIVDLVRLPEDGMSYDGEEECSILGVDEHDFVRLKDPIKYAFYVSVVSDELIVRGKISIKLAFICSRCSEDFPVFIEEKEFLQAVELEPETQSVDLTGDIREAILLLFPAYPVCSAKCKGLCPQCGVNFNEGGCDCEKPSDNRWGALNQLKIED